MKFAVLDVKVGNASRPVADDSPRHLRSDRPAHRIQTFSITITHINGRPEPITISTIVLFEWLRVPRLQEEIDAQEALFPTNEAIPFGTLEAERAAALYKAVKRPPGREADLAIAACAITHNAQLWALNRDDFKDIPDLQLLF